MNFKTTALLLALALAVVCYFFFVDSKKPSQSEIEQRQSDSPAQEGTPVFTAAPEAATVDSVTIELKTGKLELTRQGNEWTQVQPVRFPLNQWSVQGLIEQGLGLRYSRKFTPGQNETPAARDIGLDPALATLTFKGSGAKPFVGRVRLGQTTVGGRAYAMVDDGPEVYVVSDALYKAVVTQKPEEWRSRTLRNIPGFRENRAESITLARRGQPEIVAVRRDREWALAGGETGRADPKTVEMILSALMTMHIDKFVSDGAGDLALFGLEKPSMSVTLRSVITPAGLEAPAASQPAAQPATTATQTLRIGLPDPSGTYYFACWNEGDAKPDVIFTIPKSDRDRFDKSLSDFRDPRLTTLSITEIKELVLERSSESIKLERDSAGAWSFAAPAPDFKADTEAVGSLIDDALILTRADGYVANAQPAGQPTATVRLGAVARPEPEVLRVFPATEAQSRSSKAPVEDHYLVMRNNESTGMLVPRARLTKLVQPAITLRDRVVLPANAAQLSRIEIKRSGGDNVELTRNPAPPATAPAPGQPAWSLPGGQKIDAPSLEALLGAIAPLRAEAWVADIKPTAAEAKDPIELRLTLSDGKVQSAKFYPESRLGEIEGVNAFFRVSATNAEAIRSELRDRTIVGLDVEELRHVEVSEPRAEAPLRIDRDDLGNFSSPEGRSISQANAGAMFDALATLRAERYLVPPKLPADAPARRIALESKGGKKIELWLPVGPNLDRTVRATLADGSTRWFALTEETAKKLRADMIAPAKELPMPVPTP